VSVLPQAIRHRPQCIEHHLALLGWQLHPDDEGIVFFMTISKTPAFAMCSGFVQHLELAGLAVFPNGGLDMMGGSVQC